MTLGIERKIENSFIYFGPTQFFFYKVFIILLTAKCMQLPEIRTFVNIHNVIISEWVENREI